MNKTQTPGRNINSQTNNYCTPNSNSSNKVYNMSKFGLKENDIKHTIKKSNVRETFKFFALDQKFLNKKAFNDALEYLFAKFPIPDIHYTHLSNKIYDIFNLDTNSVLNEEQFINCIKELLSDKNNRMHLSMMAMMSCPNKAKRTISVDEIKNFFYESFVEGYKHMAWKINQKPDEFKIYGFPVASINQMEAWAREFEKKIKVGFEKDLKKFDPSIKDKVSFEQYQKWINEDQTLYIKYGFKNFQIATSLIIFDNVIFQDY